MPPALLVQRVVAPLPSLAAIRVDGDPPPRLAGKGEAQVAFVLREADRRAVPEGGIDVPRPEIGGSMMWMSLSRILKAPWAMAHLRAPAP